MRRITPILILLACFVFRPAAPAVAGWFDTFFSDTLVSIDGTSYTAEDFKHWWKSWQNPDQPLPETPDPYIDWLLLARAGKRMQLDEDPGFKRQTRIFLQARTLMMLRYDEVGSKIDVTDDDIQKRYEENYLPRWLVQKLQFTDEDEAKKAWEDLEKGAVTVKELVARDAEEDGPVKTRESWVRPEGIDQGWVEIFRNLAVGEVVNPDDTKGGPSLYVLKDQKGKDEEDFAKLSEGIRKDLQKEQAQSLTEELIRKLRDKYQIEVDQERIDALDINAPEESLTDAVVIASNKENVTEREFAGVLRRLVKNRSTAAHATTDEGVAQELKEVAVENIIAQEVTNWECLDRHYEKKEPFKWVYEFNYNHRLGLAVTARVLVPGVEVSEDEIKQYYDENIDRFTQPAMVKVEIIDDTQGPVDQVWADVMAGKAFKPTVKERFEINVETREVPANHLDPEVKAMVDKMAVGDTSPIFDAQDSRVVVHLVDRTPATPLPLKQVERSIRSKLRKEKINQARSTFLDKIKSQSKIEVNERQWKAIQKELGGE